VTPTSDGTRSPSLTRERYRRIVTTAELNVTDDSKSGDVRDSDKAVKEGYSSRSTAWTFSWMSEGSTSSWVAQVCPQLEQVTVTIVRLLTRSVAPACWHLGQVIGSGRFVFGTGG
jgi:hypothetical protein